MQDASMGPTDSGSENTNTTNTTSARSAAVKALRTKGTELGKAAGGRIEKVAAEGKDTVAGRISRVASAMRAAGEAMQDQEAQIANYPLRVADQLERVSTQLRERDVRALLTDIEEFARRRPELFLGAVLVAGVAVGRFLRASSPGSNGGRAQLGDGSGIHSYRRSYRGTAGSGDVGSEGGNFNYSSERNYADAGESETKSTSGTPAGGMGGGMNYASDRDYSDANHESDYKSDGSSKSERNDKNSGGASAPRSGRGATASGGGNTLDPTKVPTKAHGDKLDDKVTD